MLAAPVPFDKEGIDAVQKQLGDAFAVSAIAEFFVVDNAGGLVPGLSVKVGRVTATVTPLGIF
jgi:hypothetical protein